MIPMLTFALVFLTQAQDTLGRNGPKPEDQFPAEAWDYPLNGEVDP
jgi:hypothetical protein